MNRIVVINTKGGCGKTTISTNLASYYAAAGHNAALFDFDTQGSAMRWLKLRPETSAQIYGVTAHQNAARHVTRSFHLRLPEETERVIVDTPPGLRGPDLVDQLKGAQFILIPVAPSPMDIYATADFIRDLLIDARVRANRVNLAIIANRVKSNTLAFQALERFLHTLNIPVIAHLRDTQNYVHAAEQGMGVHELKQRPTQTDCDHWKTIVDWIEHRIAA